jgi:hypothetical protein
MQPTVIYDSSASVPGQSSLDVSRANVGFVAGDRPHFSEETAALLRTRLSAAALVIAITLAAAFVGNLVGGITTLWWLRGMILLLTVGSAIVLRIRPSLSLSKLRLLELVVFGSIVVQLSVMLMTRMAEFASLNDATSVTSVRQQFLMAWCILISIYGTLMPNTWQRGVAIMLPAAILPYLLIALQCWFSPELESLLDVNKASAALPLPLVAALVATFASHVINAARREAFKARQFGQYRLMERLGAGGMGEVYKAEHVLLKRPCAIKLIKAASETDVASIARFEKEVKTTAKLTHWNTIEIYDYGRTDDGTFYYVMELLPGKSLEELVEKYGPLPPERVVYLLRQICGALQEAHSVGLIHRDIKPANIFASQRGGVYDVAKLLDFGLVKEGNEKPDSGSKFGSFSGTPLYMSPEQATAYEDVDGRADIYSLGAVAYYLLTGQTPFTSKNVLELLAAHRNSEVSPPSRLTPTIPADLDQIILKCMAKKASDRFQDAASLKAGLDGCSVAQHWGAEQAANWWQSSQEQPVEKAEAKPSIDATVDYNGGDS